VAVQLQQVIDSSVSEFLDDLPDETFAPLGVALEEVKYGTSAKCGAQQPGLVPVLRIPNIASGRLDLREVKWTSFTEQEMENYAVRPGDLLLVRTNGNPDYVGRGTLVQKLPFTPVAYASYLLRVRVDPGRLKPGFLSIVLQHPRIRAGLMHLIRSSAGNYNLSASGLESLRFPLPSQHLQDALVHRIRTLQERADVVEEHAAASESM
jgi:type I restriction enzyme S subunit